MEHSLYKEWTDAMKSSSAILKSDKEFKQLATTYADLLKEREKYVTGLTMARKGLQAQIPPLQKIHKALTADADDFEKRVTKVAKKYEKGEAKDRMKQVLQDTESHARYMKDWDIGSTSHGLAGYRMINKPEKDIKDHFQYFMKLGKLAQKGDGLPKSVGKEILKKANQTIKLYKETMKRGLQAQECHASIMGYNTQYNHLMLKVKKPGDALAKQLQMAQKKPELKKDASGLLKHLKSIQATMAKFQG